jgi:hypothetical protein
MALPQFFGMACLLSPGLVDGQLTVRLQAVGLIFRVSFWLP